MIELIQPKVIIPPLKPMHIPKREMYLPAMLLAGGGFRRQFLFMAAVGGCEKNLLDSATIYPRSANP